jgi:NADH-quinone oxidoreductase subunit E
MGAETLAEAFQRELGIQYGQTTQDGRFTLFPFAV